MPIPADCADGFLGAFWARPAAYLDPQVRAGMSTFGRVGDVAARIERLAADVESGRWRERYGAPVERGEIDLGYRLVASLPRPGP